MTSVDDLLTSADASTVLAAMRRGEIGSLEVLAGQLERIDTFGPSVNAVVAFDLERARAEAEECDAEAARGERRGPLHGLPVTIKDVYETAGLVTAAGSPAFADHVPEGDADAVAALRAAGAIVYGKTNVPLLAGDHQTDNDVYGLTRNPWDPERSAGGSSGGAAVALSCGFTTLEVGSDIGGSIREPSHFNGVYGLKTSQGLLSLRGHIPPAPGSFAPGDLGVAGPMGRSVDDLELLLDTLLAVHPFGGVPGATLPSAGDVRLEGLRVATWANEPTSAPVMAGVADLVGAVAEDLARRGAEVDESRPSLTADELHETYLALLTATIGAGFPRKVYDRLVEASASPDAPAHIGTSVARFRDWAGADEARWRARAAWAELFDRVDVVLAPVTPTPAFPHNLEVSYWDRTTDIDGEQRPYTELLFWAGLATMPGLPSLVIPAGIIDGLPCGVQLIGPMWSERRLLAIARLIDTVIGRGFVPPPLVAA